MKTVNVCNLRWSINGNYRDTLTPSLLDRLMNGEGIADRRTVRNLASRTVQYLKTVSPRLPALYLKRYRCRGLARQVRHLFGSPAGKEWHVARVLAGCGIATFVPLAVGELRKFGLLRESFLFSRSIDRGMTLQAYCSSWSSARPDLAGPARTPFITGLAGFVKELHRRGVLHQDLHWNNILIEKNAEGVPRFYLMDLHRVKLKSRLTDGDRMKNLASLNTAFIHTTRGTERLRFLRTYAEGDSRWEGNYRCFARRIDEITDRLLYKQWRKKVKRCLRTNRYFTSLTTGGYRGFVRRDCSTPELLDLLHDPDRAFDHQGATIIKDSTTTASCLLTVLLGDNHAGVHLKRYNYQGLPYALKNCFRSSRGKRVWKTAQGLVTRGIPTAVPIACLERRRWRLLLSSYFISHNIPHARPLSNLLRGDATSGFSKSRAADSDLLIHLALLLNKMHARGVWHRDLKASNILVGQGGTGGNQLYLVDLDSTRLKKKLHRRERVRDLARLNASLSSTGTLSRTDRLRFLYAYLAAKGKRDQSVRDFWKAITVETEKKGNRKHLLPWRGRAGG